MDIFNRDMALTVISSIGSFTNASGRLIGGYFFDSIGYKKSVSFIVGLEVILISTLSLVEDIYIFGVWVIIIYYCQGALFMTMPAICTKIFGCKKGAEAFPINKT